MSAGLDSDWESGGRRLGAATAPASVFRTPGGGDVKCGYRRFPQVTFFAAHVAKSREESLRPYDGNAFSVEQVTRYQRCVSFPETQSRNWSDEFFGVVEVIAPAAQQRVLVSVLSKAAV